MDVPVVQLILENPFGGLSLPLDATDREIQHRLDEIEMDSLLGGTATENLSKLQQNARPLENPEQRILCEFYAPWFNAEIYSRVSDEHDHVLKQTATIFKSPNDSQVSEYLSALGGWIAIAGAESVRAAVKHRAQILGIELSSDWLKQEIGTRLVPLLVDRILNMLGSQPGELHNLKINGAQQIVKILEDLDAPHNIPGLESLVGHLESATDPSLLKDLTANQLIDLIGSIDAIAKLMSESSHQLWRRLTRSLYEKFNLEAHRRFEADDSEAAEEILGALAAASLPTVESLDVRRNLKSLRFGRLMEQVFRFAEAEMWEEAHNTLARAREIAPEDQADDVEHFLSIVAYRSWWKTATDHMESGEFESSLYALSNAYQHAQTVDQQREISNAMAVIRVQSSTRQRSSPPPVNLRRSWTIIGTILVGITGLVVTANIVSDFGAEADNPASQIIEELRAVSSCEDLLGVSPIRDVSPSQQLDSNSVVVFHSAENSDSLSVHDWNDELPRALRSEAVIDVDIVACISDTLESVETCRYVPSGVVHRWRRIMEVKVINVVTGDLVESQSWRGSRPRSCPSTILKSRVDLHGDYPELSRQEFVEFLESTLDSN